MEGFILDYYGWEQRKEWGEKKRREGRENGELRKMKMNKKMHYSPGMIWFCLCIFHKKTVELLYLKNKNWSEKNLLCLEVVVKMNLAKSKPGKDVLQRSNYSMPYSLVKTL
jgi:hypothetical protein